jgi:hypothetical protein
MRMDCFFVFNILDHACTTCFVFANSFQSSFANSQIKWIRFWEAFSRFWNFLPLIQMLFLWLNKTPPQWNPPLSVQEGFDVNFEAGIPIWNYITHKIPIWKSFFKTKLKDYNFWTWWWCGPFALGSCSLPLWHKSPKRESLEPL